MTTERLFCHIVCQPHIYHNDFTVITRNWDLKTDVVAVIPMLTWSNRSSKPWKRVPNSFPSLIKVPAGTDIPLAVRRAWLSRALPPPDLLFVFVVTSTGASPVDYKLRGLMVVSVIPKKHGALLDNKLFLNSPPNVQKKIGGVWDTIEDVLREMNVPLPAEVSRVLDLVTDEGVRMATLPDLVNRISELGLDVFPETDLPEVYEQGPQHYVSPLASSQSSPDITTAYNHNHSHNHNNNLNHNTNQSNNNHNTNNNLNNTTTNNNNNNSSTPPGYAAHPIVREGGRKRRSPETNRALEDKVMRMYNLTQQMPPPPF